MVTLVIREARRVWDSEEYVGYELDARMVIKGGMEMEIRTDGSVSVPFEPDNTLQWMNAIEGKKRELEERESKKVMIKFKGRK